MVIRISNKDVLIDKDDFNRVNLYRWHVNKAGYVYSNKIKMRLHRFIMKMDNYDRDKQIDHINRDKLDNRKSNLRICNTKENSRNRLFNFTNKTSSFRGVSKQKNRSNFYARIKVDGKKIHLGSFNTEIEAAKAYDIASKKYHAEFGITNF